MTTTLSYSDQSVIENSSFGYEDVFGVNGTFGTEFDTLQSQPYALSETGRRWGFGVRGSF